MTYLTTCLSTQGNLILDLLYFGFVCFYFLHDPLALFLASPLFFHATLLMGVPMNLPKVILECPDLSGKKHF